MATIGRRRALGQHFLKDSSIAQAIAEAALEEMSRAHCPYLMEIGPGKGAITHPILEIASSALGTPLGEDGRPGVDLKRMWLVEKDRVIGEVWQGEAVRQGTQPSSFRLEVEVADFLELEVQKWQKEPQFIVVSNLPYSSGTAILDRLARCPQVIPAMVLMFQAEVAQRLRADEGTKARGSLSIWLQNQWDVKKLLTAPPKAFSPPPEVQSEVVILTRRETPRISFSRPGLDKFWESFLKTCFAHRRKMLRSVLPWRNALELSGVDGTKRAEALCWDEWNRLFQAVVNETVPQPGSVR